MEKIKCRYCGKLEHPKIFSQHLKIYHKVKFRDYVKDNLSDFPNWKLCPICNENVTKGRTCGRKCDIEFRKSQTGEKSIRYGAKLSDKSKKKISNSQKIRLSDYKNKEYLMGNNNPACNPEIREKMSKIRIDKELSKGKNNPMYGKTHTPEAIKKIFSHRKMNKVEKVAADLLEENGYKYTFQFFIVEDNICKSYDFKLKETAIIVEVDGDFWHGNPLVEYHWKESDKVQENDKLKEKMAEKRGYKIIRIWESELLKEPELLINRIKNV